MNKIYQKTFPGQNSPAKRLLGGLIIRAGFTLIELLVAVLIIGILAAIALPQYERAVEKSRSAEVLVLLRSVAEANKRYYLANGVYADSFDRLDVTVPWPAKSASERSNGQWTLTIDPSHKQTNSTGAYISALKAEGQYQGMGFWYFFEEDRYKSLTGLYCVVSYYNRKDDNYCQEVMGLSNPEVIVPWARHHVYAM